MFGLTFFFKKRKQKNNSFYEFFEEQLKLLSEKQFFKNQIFLKTVFKILNKQAWVISKGQTQCYYFKLKQFRINKLLCSH